MKEVIYEVIIGALHCEMMVISGSQYIIAPHEPNIFLDEDLFSEYNSHGLGTYDYDEVRSLPMSFSHDTFSFQFDYQDPIGTWLENSFM